MYGGTGRARLRAVMVAAVCLSGTLSACESEPAASQEAREPSAATPSLDPVRAADYDAWRPTYSDVRAATEDDVRELSERVDGLNASAYTLQVPAMSIEIARSPEHARVSMGPGTTDGFELHLDPRAVGGDLLDVGPFIVCSGADAACTEVGEDREGGTGPHLFNNGLDTWVFTASTVVQVQHAADDELRRVEADGASVAVVDSPVGRLDCLVTGGRARQHARLEGRAVDLAAAAFSFGRRPQLSTTCVDERGLVVLALPSLLAPVVPYTAFEAGVPSGFDQHAEPVPYGTSPSPTSTESTTSAPDGLHQVLVAAGRIDAGESLADAQAAGRLELTTVMESELLPGAVSSTSGLDGAALRDIGEGEQITTHLFG